MLKNKFPSIKHKRVVSLAQPNQFSEGLDESDMDFYNNVVQNLTPRVEGRHTLENQGRRMSENLACNKDIQNCVYLDKESRKKKKSLVLKNSETSKNFKTSLNNKFYSKNSLFNKKLSKKKIESLKQINEIDKSKQTQQTDLKSIEQKSLNKEDVVWKQIEEMNESQLKNFIDNVSKFYEKKFSQNTKINQKVDDEVDDSQMTKKNPIASSEDNKKNDTNQINKLRVELEEIKTMIKKMNN